MADEEPVICRSLTIRWLTAGVTALALLLLFSPSVAGVDPYSPIPVSYYQAERVNDTIPGMLEAGQTYPATITFRNTGMVSWNWGVEKFGMLYQGLQSSIGVDPEFSRLVPGRDIDPGSEITFPLVLTPPEKPGDYTLSFSMATLKGEEYVTFAESSSRVVTVISQSGISSGSVGSIIVTSDPSGAEVSVGGDRRGVTPLTIPDLSPAVYELTVSSPEYRSKVIRVTVEAGSVSRLHAVMAEAGIPGVITEKDQRYTLIGFLTANLPLLILTIAVIFFGLQMLMMDTTRFPEHHPVRRFLRPITVVPVSFDGSRRGLRRGARGGRGEAAGPGEGAEDGSGKNEGFVKARTEGLTGTRKKKSLLTTERDGGGRRNRSSGEEEEEGKQAVPESDQEYQEISNPLGFPDRLKDRYEPLGVAGDDSYARVFKVRKLENGSIRALKVSHSKNTGSEILQKESSVWGNLKHPNVVKLYKAEFDDDLSFLDLEYLEGIRYRGNSLTSLSALPKPLREKYALSLIRDIAAGLKYTHSQGIRHYHLQTGDILLTPQMRRYPGMPGGRMNWDSRSRSPRPGRQMLRILPLNRRTRHGLGTRG